MNTLDAWSREEVEAAVSDYLHMLTLELSGQTYNKSEHRRNLQTKLRGRSEGSIERKHQNISAVLIDLGCPYISGYKPLSNYQSILFDVVQDRLSQDQLFDRSAISAAEQPAVMPLVPDFNFVIESPPLITEVSEPRAAYSVRNKGIQRDYLAREARNRSLGAAGEEFVIAYERSRLQKLGSPRLSEKVEQVSKTQGDGLGFDVLSFELDGRERFIEVKTTAFGKETPFFISRNETDFSAAFADQFHLYRLFEFRRQPKMFDLSGRIQDRVRLDPISYLARF
jgi:hypothetical protein